MRKSVLFVLIATSSLFAGTYIAGGEVHGTWTVEGSPYYIGGEVHVPTDSMLVIEPGCSVIFVGHYKFCIDSNAVLKAIGAETDSIVFTAQDTFLDDTTGGHNGLRFLHSADGCTLSYCKIEYGNAFGNWETNDDCGGGIYCYCSGPTIINNTIIKNRAFRGGGIYCWESNPTIANNTIKQNSAFSDGGGISCCFSDLVIDNNVVVQNLVYGEGGNGGGIYCYESNPTITSNVIGTNSAGWGGGGVCCDENSCPMIQRNIIIGNSVFYSYFGGGGICCRYYSNPTIINNIISGNSAGWGGGIYCKENSNLAILNNTISGNTAVNCGGGICCLYNSNPVIFNTIFSGDSASAGSEVYIGGEASYPCSLFISYTNVDSSECYIEEDMAGTIIWGPGNIDADPLFADTLFHLSASSPCIDAGAESVYVPIWDTVLYAPNSDFERELRPSGSGWDIGADEFSSSGNRPPEITTCPDETLEIIPADTTVWLSIDFYDPDSDEIFCNVFEYPESYSHWGAESTYYWGFGGTGSIRFAFYPDISDTGLYHFAFEACDSVSGLCDTCGFWVRVVSPEENHPPIIGGCPEDTVFVVASGRPDTSIGFWAEDEDSDTLYFSWIEHPDGYGIWWVDTNDFAYGIYNGRIYFYPSSEDTGTYNFTFSVCDDELCDTCEFVVVVLPDTTNNPPMIVGCPEDTIVASTIGAHFTFSAFDPDSDNLHFLMIEFPDSADIFSVSVDTAGPDCNGTFHFYSDCYPGIYAFAFAVCDEEYCDTCRFFVRTLNPAPYIIDCSYDTISITAGTDTSISFFAYDSCSIDTLSFELIEHPVSDSWWTDTIHYGYYADGWIMMHFFPSLWDTGTFNFTFRVCDQWGQCDTCGVVVAVSGGVVCAEIESVSASPISSREIELLWSYSGGVVPDSAFVWRVSESETTLIANLPGDVAEFVDTGLMYATEYTYRLAIWSEVCGTSDVATASARTYYFRRNPDGFSFCNCGGVVWPYDDGTPSYPFPDWTTFVVAYGEDQVLDPYGNPRPAATAFWNAIKGHWGGSCFGFSCVSLHLFGGTPPYDITGFGVSTTIEIPLGDTIRRFINAEQIRQPYYSTYIGHGTIPGLYWRSYHPTPSGASGLISDLAANMVDDLQLLCFFVYGWGGHAIVPYELDTISDTEYRIYCYDNWSAYYDYYFDINTETGAMVYHRGWGSPSVQSVSSIVLCPSRPFAQPPIMDFYSGSGSKDLAFSGTGQGFLSVKVKETSIGDSSFFSIDTFYNSGEEFIVLIPSDTAGGPSFPDWALQLSPGNYIAYMVGDSTPGAKILLTSVGRLYTMQFPNLGYNDTVVISIHLDGSYSVSSSRVDTMNLHIAALLDTVLKNEGLYQINIPEFSGTLEVGIREATPTEMKVALKKSGGDTISYRIHNIMTTYEDSTRPQDTVSFQQRIPFVPGEQQIVDAIRSESVWDAFIARDVGRDGIYEDTIFTTSSIQDGSLPIHFALSVVPNPFNSSLSITYSITSPQEISLEVYDIMGHRIEQLFAGHRDAGNYTAVWKPSENVPSGIYLIRLKTERQTIVRRAVLIR